MVTPHRTTVPLAGPTEDLPGRAERGVAGAPHDRLNGNCRIGNPIFSGWLTWPQVAHCLAALTFLACAGCSTGGPSEPTSGPARVDEADITAIKKSSKAAAQFRGLVRAKVLEGAGIIKPKTSTGKGQTTKAR